eukprot:GDKJ01010645.1.p1 GENE.GDKJ01010645.1~~GDKJ01010645.1.p1  ORF type:complete len:226 (+),score=43.83 GDKJ01010645.1:29-706(+)
MELTASETELHLRRYRADPIVRKQIIDAVRPQLQKLQNAALNALKELKNDNQSQFLFQGDDLNPVSFKFEKTFKAQKIPKAAHAILKSVDYGTFLITKNYMDKAYQQVKFPEYYREKEYKDAPDVDSKVIAAETFEKDALIQQRIAARRAAREVENGLTSEIMTTSCEYFEDDFDAQFEVEQSVPHFGDKIIDSQTCLMDDLDSTSSPPQMSISEIFSKVHSSRD